MSIITQVIWKSCGKGGVAAKKASIDTGFAHLQLPKARTNAATTETAKTMRASRRVRNTLEPFW